MNRTFLVTVNADSSDPAFLSALADDIFDELEASSIPVTEVKPWSSQSSDPLSSDEALLLPSQTERLF